MNGLWQDFRHGAYMLRKNVGFTTFAALTLAIGIASTTTIFGVVNAVILRPLPFVAPDRLVQIWETTPRGDDFSASEPNFLDFAAQNQSVATLAAFRPWDLTLTGGGAPRRLRGVAASHTLFPMLGVKPALGRTFTAGEDADGDSSRVVVLADALWRSRFGADSTLVGRTITLGGSSYTVIGILPAGQRFPAGDAFVPLHASARSDRGDHWLQLVGRLREGISLEQAEADFSRVARGVASANPSNAGWGVRIEPLSLALVDAKVRRGGWIMLGATALLLFLACANVANLLLVRATARQMEMGVRAAIGAGRSRLVQQLLIETGALVAIAAILGVLMAGWGTEAVRVLGAGRVPRLDEVAIDGRVMLAALGLTIATALACGLPSAWRASRVDPASVLGEGARGGVTRRQRRVRDSLVVLQVALSILLLVGAGLLLRSFSRLSTVNAGFDIDRVIAVNLNFPRRYDEEGRVIFFRRVTRALTALPGVQAAGAASIDPLTDWNLVNDVTPEDRAASTPASGFMQAAWRTVTPEYFATMGMPLRRGRWFDASDLWNGPRNVVVSERFAARMWPGQDPIGKRLFWGGTSGNTRTVIGVVGDVRDVSPETAPWPTLYLPYNQLPFDNMTLLVRADGDHGTLSSAIADAVHAIDPLLPVEDVHSVARNRENAMTTPRFNLVLIGAFACVALVLASSGVYAVVAYSVAHRQREIGVRMAIGALPEQVVQVFVRGGLVLTAVGAVFGIVAAWSLTGLMRSLLYETAPSDPLTFIAVTAVLGAVGLLSSYIPARRAAQIAPVDALRRD